MRSPRPASRTSSGGRVASGLTRRRCRPGACGGTAHRRRVSPVPEHRRAAHDVRGCCVGRRARPGMTADPAVSFGLDLILTRHVVGLAVAFGGVAIVVGFGSGSDLSFESAKGPLIVIGAPLAFALYNVILKPLSRPPRPSRSDGCDEPRRHHRARTVRPRLDGRHGRRRDRGRGRASRLSRRPCDVARIHPLERRAAGYRSDACGVLHVRDLTARRGDRRDRAGRDRHALARPRRRARHRRHRPDATRVCAETSWIASKRGRRAHPHSARAEPARSSTGGIQERSRRHTPEPMRFVGRSARARTLRRA